MGTFCHLHVASRHSMRRSLVKLELLVARLQELGQPAVAITDHDGLCGVVPFDKLARAHGIHPVLGCELSVLTDQQEPRPVTLLAETRQGYSNLCQLITRAQRTSPVATPREVLLERSAGLILLTGGEDAELPALIAARQEGEASRILRLYREAFAGRLYFELMPCHRTYYLLDRLRALSRALDIPAVVTQDVRYLTEREAGLWRTLLYSHNLGHPTNQPRHLADEAEMRRLWHDWPEAIPNTTRIAERCQVDLGLGVPRLPHFELPAGVTIPDDE